MFSNIFGKKKNKSKNKDKDKDTPKITLLVIKTRKDDKNRDGDDFYQLFSKPNNRLSDGRLIYVEQAGWDSIQLTSYSDSLKPVVNIRTGGGKFKCIQPDFILIRELCRGVKPGQDHKNLLYAFMVAQTPSINSLHSIFCLNERALMNAEMIRLNRKYGQDKFPIITQYFYPVHEEMLITPNPYPIVLKIGTYDAGYGKIKLDNHSQFGDMKSIIATQGEYVTAERFLKGKYDLRLQKIGNDYKAFKRTAMSGQWKTNTQTAVIEWIKVEERYKFWMDQCSKAFGGGLDICTVDILVEDNDENTEYILEFNGCASGFGDKDKDNITLRDYVIQKLNDYFVDGNNNEEKENYYPTNDNLVRPNQVKDIDKYDPDKYKVDDDDDDQDQKDDANENVDNDTVEDKDKDEQEEENESAKKDDANKVNDHNADDVDNPKNEDE